jgi:BirA family transcriptional regulator, biotin operon repressor / biotin---[acetyl-CoA-carboxylase] ligase
MLRRYDALDSTNQEAQRLARAGIRGPLWITAGRQTAGRGRHGREWVSERGNLFATLLMGAVPPRSAEIGFIAGISAADVIARYVPDNAIKLKWPNDVLIGDRKVAGILVEHASPDIVAAGIGINLANCPPVIGAASVYDVTGFAPDPDDVLTMLALEMERWLVQWRKDGFTRIRQAWLARARGIGQPIRAVTAQACFDGIFEKLDDDGALLLRDGAGASHRLTAADVFYGDRSVLE